MTFSETALRLERDEVWARLVQLSGAFCLHDEGQVFVGALPAEVSSELDPKNASAEQVSAPLEDWPEWVGVLPYESFRHLERGSPGRSGDPREEPHISSVIWKRYGAISRVTSEGLLVRGARREDVDAFVTALLATDPRAPSPEPTLTWARPPEDGALHRERVRAALKRIGRGELYQVNLARRFEFEASGHPISILNSLGSMAGAPFAAALDFGLVQVVSTSPELFLDYRPDGMLQTRPIKGTRPRSADPMVDERLKEELDRSEKERAELAMVVDIERNDLGRLAVPGTVKMTHPPSVVSYPTVHHREATVFAQLAPEFNRADVLAGMLPSGSVTGAPKVAAMDLIAELEAERRGLYTGALGYLTYGGGARLSMAIRVLTIKGGRAHYFAGGGIVADSDPEQELQETTWKAEQLRALVPLE